MTRKELTGKRDLTFSGWIRNNLPDSSVGYGVSDLDFIICNWKEKKIMFVEVKTNNGSLTYFQKSLYTDLHRWIKNGIDNEWKYYGFNLIVFEHSSFDDGKCFLNNREINETDLINYLSFK